MDIKIRIARVEDCETIADIHEHCEGYDRTVVGYIWPDLRRRFATL
jgi:hypothetical protein